MTARGNAGGMNLAGCGIDTAQPLAGTDQRGRQQRTVGQLNGRIGQQAAIISSIGLGGFWSEYSRNEGQQHGGRLAELDDHLAAGDGVQIDHRALIQKQPVALQLAQREADDFFADRLLELACGRIGNLRGGASAVGQGPDE